MAPTRNEHRSSTSADRGRTVKHVDPLAKGLACIPCQRRRVRCSGEHPACEACIRHARWKGRNPKTNHGCSYKVREEDSDDEEEEQHEQLVAARLKIVQLEQRLVKLEAELSAERPSNVSDSHSFSRASSTHSDSTSADVLPMDYFTDTIFSFSAAPIVSTVLSQPPSPPAPLESSTFTLPTTLPDVATLANTIPLALDSTNVSYSDFSLPPSAFDLPSANFSFANYVHNL